VFDPQTISATRCPFSFCFNGPSSAAVLAAVFLGEQLPAGTYAGLALIMVGLAIVVFGQRARRRAGGHAQEPGQPLAGLGTD
jgi:drug/metabolite transporter (DMT)-like permease